MPGTVLKAGRTAEGFIVRVVGRGTAQESPSLSAFVGQYLEAHEQASLFVDLSGCDYLDSTFLGCLLTLHQQCQGRDAFDFHVVADDAKRKKLLSPTKLDSVLEVTAGGPQALGGFVDMTLTKLDKRAFGRHVVDSHRALADLPCPQAGLFRKIADQLAQELNRPDDIRETV